MRYAQEGHDLILAARKSEDLHPFKIALETQYAISVTLEEFDITAISTHLQFYSQLQKKPNTAVLAVGYLGDQKQAEEHWEETEKILSVNLVGAISILNIIAQDFEKRKEGLIIGISSVAGDRGRKKNYIYGCAKAGLSAYLSGLRNRLYASNVHVITVKPGFIKTKMTQHMALPKYITASAREIAEDILIAEKKKKDIIYSKWFWKVIMGIMIHIPEKIFKTKNF